MYVGTWQSIWYEIVHGDMWTVIDEILHVLDHIPNFPYPNWRYRFCNWAHTRKGWVRIEHVKLSFSDFHVWFTARWYGMLLMIWFFNHEIRLQVDNPIHPVTLGYRGVSVWYVILQKIYCHSVVALYNKYGWCWQAKSGVIPLRMRTNWGTYWQVRSWLWSIVGLATFKLYTWIGRSAKFEDLEE